MIFRGRNKHDYGIDDEDYNHDGEIDEDAPVADPVKFESAVAPEAKQQFADILVNRVKAGFPGRTARGELIANVKQCQKKLKADDKDDKRVIDAINDALTRVLPDEVVPTAVKTITIK